MRTTYILVLVASILQAESGSQVPEYGSPHDLVLDLAPSKPVYSLYEPVVVIYSARNPTNRPIRAIVELEYELHRIGFSITDPDGNRSEYQEGSLPYAPAIERIHAPGFQYLSENEMMNNASTGLAFPRPGRYQIHASLWVGNYPKPVVLKADPISVQIREPAGRDASAIAYFPSKEAFLTLVRYGTEHYCAGRPTPSCFEEIRAFLAQHEASSYAPRIMRDLADFAVSPRSSLTPKPDAAIALFERYLKLWPAHPQRYLVMARLVEVLHDAGRTSEAAQVLERFDREYPGRKGILGSVRQEVQSQRPGARLGSSSRTAELLMMHAARHRALRQPTHSEVGV